MILIVNGCMDIVRILLEPKLHCFYEKIGKTVTNIQDLQKTNNLLFITKNKDCQNVNKYDSMLNILNKNNLFYSNNNKNKKCLIEFEVNLSEFIVTDIDIIDDKYDKDNNCINYLIGINLVYKRYFKKCINPSIILIKLNYDKYFKKFTKCNQLYRHNLSKNINDLCPLLNNILSFKLLNILEKIIIISMGSQIIIYVIDNEYKLIECHTMKLSDFVVDILYNYNINLISVLFENKGIEMFEIFVNNGIDNFSSLNIIKSWDGISNASKHLSLSSSSSLDISLLICNQRGNISILTLSNNDKILQNKYNIDLINNNNNKCQCCLNKMIECVLFHNNESKSVIIAMCCKGCVHLLQ